MGKSTLKNTSAILECIKPSEYNALSDANKEVFKIIISCGAINIAPGGKLRERLLTMFGEESDSYNALMASMGTEPPDIP
jgi:hypothetical protein